MNMQDICNILTILNGDNPNIGQYNRPHQASPKEPSEKTGLNRLTWYRHKMWWGYTFSSLTVGDKHHYRPDKCSNISHKPILLVEEAGVSRDIPNL